jgi:hypothetical protein
MAADAAMIAKNAAKKMIETQFSEEHVVAAARWV